nr:MAG TPA: hypothetical protein [Caudoviricetes sp.]
MYPAQGAALARVQTSRQARAKREGQILKADSRKGGRGCGIDHLRRDLGGRTYASPPCGRLPCRSSRKQKRKESRTHKHDSRTHLSFWNFFIPIGTGQKRRDRLG